MCKKDFAPGRINLIGEHLDYNGGLVLPACLTMGIYAEFDERKDNKILLRSASHSLEIEIDLNDELNYDPENDWTNYPIGIIQQLKKENHFVPPCTITYKSDLPEGAGLSSSAAIEVLTAFLLLSQSESQINRSWLASFCRQVENEFIGVNCGIMDQFIIAAGKKDYAVLLDCATHQHVYVPIELGDYRLLIMNSNKPRKLIHSKYNERKAECEEALKKLQAAKPDLRNLADADMIWIEVIDDPVLKKRVRHVISENIRVKEAAKTLQMNDLSTLGRLMNASHASLKNDYEVTGIELDTLVEEAQKIKGCLGARMTGAGFGGCAFAIVHQSAVEELKDKVSEGYFAITGLQCEFYESEIGDGVNQTAIER